MTIEQLEVVVKFTEFISDTITAIVFFTIGYITSSILKILDIAFVPKLPHIKGEWYRYIWPRRLTLKTNPPVYRWICFNFGFKGQ